MIKPIRPQDIGVKKQEAIPSIVIETFNKFIALGYVNGSAKVDQNSVVNALVQLGLDKQEIHDKGWLNVEEMYRRAGWRVVYDSSGFNETYPATFWFYNDQKDI